MQTPPKPINPPESMPPVSYPYTDTFVGNMSLSSDGSSGNRSLTFFVYHPDSSTFILFDTTMLKIDLAHGAYIDILRDTAAINAGGSYSGSLNFYCKIQFSHFGVPVNITLSSRSLSVSWEHFDYPVPVCDFATCPDGYFWSMK